MAAAQKRSPGDWPTSGEPGMSFAFKADIGNRRILLDLGRHPQRIRVGIRQGFFALGRELRDGVRQKIKEGPTTGRLYRIKGRRRRHRASAPGEAPANLSGKLRASVGFDIRGTTQMEFGYRDTVGYGGFLEVGTKNMDPRPALTPQVNESAKNARTHFDREIQKALKV